MADVAWWRKYPPLAGLGAIVFIAAAVLPSSLVLPQTQPATTLEYAPVPASDVNAAPPGGSLSSLGLATTGGLRERAAAVDTDPRTPPRPAAVGKNPSTKRCIGDPPRQTEDPSSPPCVAYFKGDNFGDTHHGVTRDEVRVLFYFNGNMRVGPTGRGTEETPSKMYYDLGEPPREDDPPQVRGLRVLQRYFNDRFQTYDRFVRFFVYYDEGVPDPNAFKANASDNFTKVHPFAAIINSVGYEDLYLEEMARRGVLNFGARYARPASYFRRYPSLIWSYLPMIEFEAKVFSDYVCRKVVNEPVAFGDESKRGQPRVLGFIYTTDYNKSGPRHYARLVEEAVRGCGGTFAARGEVPQADGFYVGQTPDYAYTNMADFKQKGVTTVIWAQGTDTFHSPAAKQLNYFPEWILGGNRYFEGSDIGRLQDQDVWRHAWVVSHVTAVPRFEESLCARAFTETDPHAARGDASFMCNAYRVYDDLRQLFTGIQVAGPRLNPSTIDKGFHAIPPVASTDPRVAACFYDPDDYTCVKDAIQMWWDPEGQSPNMSGPGCWRMTERGHRYLRGAWPDGNVGAQKGGADDPCNGYVATSSLSA